MTGPFAAEELKELLLRPRDHPNYVLTDRQLPPSMKKLELLARQLNNITAVYHRATTIAKAAKAQRARVRDALENLMIFFDERRHICETDKSLDAGTIESERQLYGRFYDFVKAIEQHQFNLDPDAAMMMADVKSWHNVAEIVAGWFKFAMPESLGNSNDGPVARFVAAVIPQITGETPSVTAVAQHLKRGARKPTGTNGK